MGCRCARTATHLRSGRGEAATWPSAAPLVGLGNLGGANGDKRPLAVDRGWLIRVARGPGEAIGEAELAGVHRCDPLLSGHPPEPVATLAIGRRDAEQAIEIEALRSSTGAHRDPSRGSSACTPMG